ncbi:hypothetical protein BHE74_00024560 [Ensete ventricosum]|nr:hypothetical protein BHE74_00024560 [Ensete ventricosum]
MVAGKLPWRTRERRGQWQQAGGATTEEGVGEMKSSRKKRQQGRGNDSRGGRGDGKKVRRAWLLQRRVARVAAEVTSVARGQRQQRVMWEKDGGNKDGKEAKSAMAGKSGRWRLAMKAGRYDQWAIKRKARIEVADSTDDSYSEDGEKL